MNQKPFPSTLADFLRLARSVRLRDPERARNILSAARVVAIADHQENLREYRRLLGR